MRIGVEFLAAVTAKAKFERATAAILLAALMLMFGFPIAAAGYSALRNWSFLGAAFAACGALWIVTGPAMLLGGFWLLGTLGRNPIPLWIGGVAAALSGGSMVAGVLTYVIPCSGPS